MNTLEIKGDWNITKGKLKQKWASSRTTISNTSRASKTIARPDSEAHGETREAVEKAIKESCSSCGCK